jgi:hypothetical protein
MIAMILTIFVVYLRLFSLGWGTDVGDADYPAVEQFLVKKKIEPNDIVIVRNAPGYYLETGRSAIAIPYGGEQAILDVSRQFDARYLVLEPEVASQPVANLFQSQQGREHFIYLGELDGTRIFKIELK